jgi:hypothetical protein
MSLLILQHLVGYLSDSVQFKIAEAAQAAREAARQGRSKRFCPGTPHSIVVRTTYIRPDISFFSSKKNNYSEVGGCGEFRSGQKHKHKERKTQ